MTGTAYFLFASMIPTMSAMKYWLVVSTTLTLSYIVVVVVALIENGKEFSSSSSMDYYSFWIH